MCLTFVSCKQNRIECGHLCAAELIFLEIRLPNLSIVWWQLTVCMCEWRSETLPSGRLVDFFCFSMGCEIAVVGPPSVRWGQIVQDLYWKSANTGPAIWSRSTKSYDKANEVEHKKTLIVRSRNPKLWEVENATSKKLKRSNRHIFCEEKNATSEKKKTSKLFRKTVSLI